MIIEKASYCKVNLLLNILGRREDGFHEIETIFYPIVLSPEVCDVIRIERGKDSISLSCSNKNLPCDSGNIVYRAAEVFLKRINSSDGVKIHLEKRLPLSSGIGAGSANAATTLLVLNELFSFPLDIKELHSIAANLGADVPFFLYSTPALATGKGEKLTMLEPFVSLRRKWIILVYPGFGVSTPWAYSELTKFPELVNGKPGRARQLAKLLNEKPLSEVASEFFNAFEAPVFRKYPLISIFKETCLKHGATVAMMSGSGSTVFAITESKTVADKIHNEFIKEFGSTIWITTAQI